MKLQGASRIMATSVRKSCTGLILAAGVVLGLCANPAAALEPIKVGLPGLSIGYASWFVAKAAGMFEKNGLDATFVTLSDDTLPAALISGGIQATPLTGSVTSGNLAGFKIKSVGLLMSKLPWMILAKNSITTVQALKGKQIITSPPKAAPNILLSFFLINAGLDPGKDVELLHIGPVAARQSLMQAGHADAIIDDVKSGFLLQEDMKDLAVLVPSSAMPNQVGTGLGVSEELIAKNPDLVKRMLRTLVEANSFIRHHTGEAAPILAKELKMPPLIGEKATEVLITDFSPTLVPAEQVYINEARLRVISGDQAMTPDKVKATWDTRLAAEIDNEMAGQ